MEKAQQSPWLVIALVIVGIVIGYALVIHPGTTATATTSNGVGGCLNKELCKNNQGCGCNGAADCQKGNCPGNCPGRGA